MTCPACAAKDAKITLLEIQVRACGDAIEMLTRETAKAKASAEDAWREVARIRDLMKGR